MGRHFCESCSDCGLVFTYPDRPSIPHSPFPILTPPPPSPEGLPKVTWPAHRAALSEPPLRRCRPATRDPPSGTGSAGPRRGGVQACSHEPWTARSSGAPSPARPVSGAVLASADCRRAGLLGVRRRPSWSWTRPGRAGVPTDTAADGGRVWRKAGRQGDARKFDFRWGRAGGCCCFVATVLHRPAAPGPQPRGYKNVPRPFSPLAAPRGMGWVASKWPVLLFLRACQTEEGGQRGERPSYQVFRK